MIKSFSEYLNEALIVFDNKRPNYNTVVILAGGPASGKSMVGKLITGINAKVLGTDELNKFVSLSNTLKRKIYIKNDKIDFSDPVVTNAIRQYIIDSGLYSRKLKTIFDGIIKDSMHKPNLIFDMTLSNESKLHRIIKSVTDVGYNQENIHIVWVYTSVDEAIQNNKDKIHRGREVDETELIKTHKAVKIAIKDILTNPQFQNIGTMTVVFNYNDNVKLNHTKKSIISAKKITFPVSGPIPKSVVDILEND